MQERGPVELIEHMERRYRRMRRFQEFTKQLLLSMTLSTGSYGAMEAFSEIAKDDPLPHD